MFKTTFKLILLFAIFLSIIISNISISDPLSGKIRNEIMKSSKVGTVVDVKSGDEIVVSFDKEKKIIKLIGIQAPPADSPMGKKATNFLKKRVLKKKVHILSEGTALITDEKEEKGEKIEKSSEPAGEKGSVEAPSKSNETDAELNDSIPGQSDELEASDDAPKAEKKDKKDKKHHKKDKKHHKKNKDKMKADKETKCDKCEGKCICKGDKKNCKCEGKCKCKGDKKNCKCKGKCKGKCKCSKDKADASSEEKVSLETLEKPVPPEPPKEEGKEPKISSKDTEDLSVMPAYVYYKKCHFLINATMVKLGYAFIANDQNKYKNEFIVLLAHAQKHKLGIWKNKKSSIIPKSKVTKKSNVLTLSLTGFEQKEITVPKGSVRIFVENTDKDPICFAMLKDGSDRKNFLDWIVSEVIPANSKKEIKINLKEGQYEYFLPLLDVQSGKLSVVKKMSKKEIITDTDKKDDVETKEEPVNLTKDADKEKKDVKEVKKDKKNKKDKKKNQE